MIGHKILGARPSDQELSAMIIICHRGISNLYLENSLTAFRRLSNYSGTWVEFDIHATVDDVLIVYHDFDLSRLTTTKDPRLIREMLYSEIQKLTLINGEKIPTLAEVMKVIPSSHTINIELKGEGTGFLVDSIVQQKREDESYLKQTIIFSSFLKNRK